MVNETIYNVHWKGPYKWAEREADHIRDCHVLYQIYGPHPLYGKEVLLYIGSSLRVKKRLREQEDDFLLSDRADKASFRVGSVGKFTTWQDWLNQEEYEQADDDLIKRIEALLIYAHQPVYNLQHMWQADIAIGIRIFNSGQYGDLLPEVSHRYHHFEVE